MSENSQPRPDATPKMAASSIGRDLGEAIYARHARCVWPTSIASSLAQRFTHFTDNQLPLASVLQRRWSVANSSVTRMPDLHWLHAFGPGSPRHAASARRQEVGPTIAASLAPSKSTDSTPEAAHSVAPEIHPSAAVNLAPSANPAGETAAPNAVTHESGSAHRSTEIARKITSLSGPATPTRIQPDLAPPVVELAHRTPSDVSHSADNLAPPAHLPQDSGTTSASRTVQKHASQERPAAATQQSSQASTQIDRVSAPEHATPTVHTNSVNVTGVARMNSNLPVDHPVTVFNAPPIIRRSLTSRQSEVARGVASEPSAEIHGTLAQKSASEVQVGHQMPTGPIELATSADRALYRSTDSQIESSPIGPVVERAINNQIASTELHHLEAAHRASRSLSAVSRPSHADPAGPDPMSVAARSQVGLLGDTSQNSALSPAPPQNISREHAPSHELSIMTHAITGSRDASTQHAPSRGSVIERAAVQQPPPSLSRQGVPDNAAPSWAANLTELQRAPETDTVALTANGVPREHTVSESHINAPAVAMLHRDESVDRTSTEPLIERTVESSTSSLPSSPLRERPDMDRSHVDRLPADVVLENRPPVVSPSILHLQHESVSAASPADSLDRSRASIADGSSPEFTKATLSGADGTIPASTSPVHVASSNYAPSRSSGRNVSSTTVESSALSRGPEPTFRSTSTHLRSPGTGVVSAHGSRPAVLRDTTMPLVVQESVIARPSHGEPMVLSSAISGGTFQRLSASGLASGIAPATYSPAAIAPQAIHVMHRSSSTMVRSAAYPTADPMHFATMPVSRQAASAPALGNTQPPSLPSMSASAATAPSSGGASPDITQLANRVYDVLVRRLASERQRRGR